MPCEEIKRRPDLLKIGHDPLEEVYFEFQFDSSGVNHELGSLVESLHREYDDIEIADWLVHRNDELGGYTPLQWQARGFDHGRLLHAARERGPYHDRDGHALAA